MWQELLVALALLMVIEGLMPFLSPKGFRQTMLSMAQLDDRSLRSVGLVLMVAGVITLYWVR